MRPASITVTTWPTRRRAIKHSGLRVAKDVRCSFAYPKKSPVVLTCGVSVLQDLTRTKAVLGGL